PQALGTLRMAFAHLVQQALGVRDEGEAHRARDLLLQQRMRNVAPRSLQVTHSLRRRRPARCPAPGPRLAAMVGMDLEATITFPGGKRVDADLNGRSIPTDQPAAVGGEGTAPEPFALFAASIGTCA